MMPSKPTSSARAYCSWYSLYSTCAFMGSKWVLGKPRRPESYLLRSSSVTYPLGCSENQKTSTCSVGRRSCSTIRASCLLGMVTGIPPLTFAVPRVCAQPGTLSIHDQGRQGCRNGGCSLSFFFLCWCPRVGLLGGR